MLRIECSRASRSSSREGEPICLSIPGRVVAVEGERSAETLIVPDVAVGDHVIVTGGLIVARLSEDEARTRLALFAELQATSGE